MKQQNPASKQHYSERPFYPVLVAIFIPVNMVAQNISLFSPEKCLRAAAAFLLAAVIIFFLLNKLVRQRDGTALVTALFFAGIWVYQFPTSGRILYLAIVVVAVVMVWRGLCAARLTQGLNLVMLAIILQPVFVIASNQWWLQTRDTQSLSYSPFTNNVAPDPGERSLPVIVHILLDGYADHEILTDLLDFDNSEFEAELESLGFAVAADPRTPYNRTRMVMPAIFAGTYLRYDEPPLQNANINWAKLALSKVVTDGPVKRSLGELGYKFLYTEPGFKFWHFGRNDIVSEPQLKFLDLNSFEQLLLERTSLKLVPRTIYALLNRAGYKSAGLIEITRHALETEFYKDHEGPYLLYEHVLAPHPPFNVDREGRSTNKWSMFWGLADGSHATYGKPSLQRLYVNGYLEKLRYVNGAILDQVKRMIRDIPAPKVIMIHGDHGSGAYYFPEDLSRSCLKERYKPFLAVYADDPAIHAAFAHITTERVNLVNLYRIIFDARFGTELSLAPDRSWFVQYDTPPVEVTELSDEQIEADCVLPDPS